jgi:hypothetical protein
MKRLLVLTLALAAALLLPLWLLPKSEASHVVNAKLSTVTDRNTTQKLVRKKVASNIPLHFKNSTKEINSLLKSATPQTKESKKGVQTEDRMSSMGRLAHLAVTGQLEKVLAKARAKAANRSAENGFVDDEEPCDDEEEPCVGDDDEGDGPAGGQAELSIAVDSSGQHIVVGANDTRGFALNPTSVSGFAYSDDGGQTFIDGGQLPVNTGTSTIGTTILPQVFGDPEVKYLGGGNFIYFSIMVKQISATATAQTMCVHRSTDYGHTWTGPFEIPPATRPHNSNSDSADKEFADVDPETGRVMMSWTAFTSGAFAPAGVEMSTTFSDNIMTATPPTWSARRIVSATSADGQASIPRFAGNSGSAYVTWRRFAGNNQNVGFARSTDNGATWGAPINIAPSNFFTMDQVLGNDRVNTSPGMAVDSVGNIYIVYSNNNSHDGADIAFQRSTDGGLSFSAPVLLNSRPGNDRPQWFPWINVDNSTGRIYTFYLDQGIAASGDLTETTYQYSDNSGVTWSKPLPLTDRPFHAGYGNDTGQPNLGDYNQAVAQNGELFVVWAGSPNEVLFADGQPTSASFTVPDIYFKRVSTAKTALSLGNVTFTESGGNGKIDIGDQVNLQLPLRNYVTNPLSASTISGIIGVLSTTTPGVNIIQANSAYPDIAAGTTAGNSANYVLQILPSFVAGTHIELALNVSGSQGSATLLSTLSTGTPNATTFFSENFNSTAAGSLPVGWSNQHGGGANTVSWTTNNTLFGTASNAAFHQNANDGVGGTGNPIRTERLLSPQVIVPTGADYVTLDFDVAYDTEDDPAFNIQAFDGLVFRFVDFSPGGIARNVLAESFAEEFTTGTFQHYPKHLPRSSNTAYFQDMSVWAGDSAGFKHVHMKLPGMAGSTIQLRWEFTQDSSATCANVRPGHTCGVMVDNVVLQGVTAAQPTTLTVDAAAGQYSDQVTLKATVSPNVVNFLGGTQTATGNVQFSVNGSNVGSPVAINSSGVATLPYTIPLAPGSYATAATFVSSNAAFLGSSGNSTLSVTQEDAAVAFSNPFSVKVNSPGGTAGPINFCADITEVPDGSAGNISNANASFSFSPVAGGASYSFSGGAVTYTGGGVGGTLHACVTLNSVPVDVYDVAVSVGGYYTGSGSSVLVVYDPSLGFVTGGGRVSNPDTGCTANFGLNVKYLKNGKPQGSVLYMEHCSTGDTKLKGNVMQSVSIVGRTAVIIGKGPLNGVGNYGFRINVTDNGEPGSSDLFGLQITAPNGSVVPGYNFAPRTIDAGNIQVPQNAK